MSMRIEENDIGWVILFDDGHLEMIQIDFRLSLLLAEEKCRAWIHIEQAACLRREGREVILMPDQTLTLTPILGFFNSPVASIKIEKKGHLQVKFHEDCILEIEPHEMYEAWQVECSGTGGDSMFVCSPGGEVALFR